MTKFIPLYGFASIFGPFFGNLFWGFLLASVEGYEVKKLVYILVLFEIISLISSFIIIYSDSISIICIGLFLFLFFTNSLLSYVKG